VVPVTENESADWLANCHLAAFDVELEMDPWVTDSGCQSRRNLDWENGCVGDHSEARKM